MKIVKKTLDELGYVRRGKSKHRPRDATHLYDGPYPFIQTSDVKNAGLYITEYTQTYSAAGLAQSKLWKAGTLCITIAANIGDTAILSFDACFPDSIVGFIPDSQKTDARYIKYLFGAVMQQRFKKFTQGATQDNLSQEKLLSLKLPVADDVGDQKEIADRIAIYDTLIDVNRRRIQLLEESARLLYREWFVYFRFPGHEKVKIVDGVPKGWERKRLSNIVSFFGGHAFKSSSYQQEGKYGIVTIRNVQQGSFISDCANYLDETPIGIKKHCFLSDGDILISLTGNVGRVCLVFGTNYLLNQRVAKIEAKNTIPKSFIYWMFDNSIMQKRIENLSYGSAQQNLSPIKLGEQIVIFPPGQLLKVFDEIAGLINTEIIQLLIQNQKLVQARDLLLPRLMSGAIEVSEFDTKIPQEAET